MSLTRATRITARAAPPRAAASASESERSQANKNYRPPLPICDTLLPWLSPERDYQVARRKRQDKLIKSIKTSWRKLRSDAGLDADVVPYSLRHTVAVALRKAGVPEWECQGFMGHRTAGTTERYAKFQPDRVSASVKAIDEFCSEIHDKVKTPIILGTPISTRQFCVNT